MSTRAAAGFRVDGKDKLQYVHSDGYPDGLGRDTLEFIRDVNLEALKEHVRKIRLVTEKEKPTDEEQQRYSKWANAGVASRSMTDWYVLLREAQGEWAPYANGDLDVMLSGNTFVYDSLFCEYAYIINLDTMELEFYTGFNHSPSGRGRYASTLAPSSQEALDRAKKAAEEEHGAGGAAVAEVTHAILEDAYYGISLVDTIDLNSLQARLKRARKTGIARVIQRWEKLDAEKEST